MSTFRYHNKFGEPVSGVECDACGFRLYTDTEGQCFGEHIRTAKQNGWLITKKCSKWLNLCPKCKEALEVKKRTDFIRSITHDCNNV